ncbi:MAG: DCC1-like thiol-disulfide oxidoreductase family protein [Panacagrimonas sp.]
MNDSSGTKNDELTLIYDGECPVCTAYSGSVDVGRGAAAGIRRIDARGDDAMVRAATAAGLDLDEGMVVAYRGALHHGADALHLMATLAPSKGLRNRLNRLLFGSRALSRVLYPALRAGRNLLLRLLGRKKIRNLA